MKRTLILLSSMAIVLAWAMLVLGQPGQPPALDRDKNVEEEGPPIPGVYVPDSGEARQKIRQARRLARAKLWDMAAQLLHEVQSRYGNKVLATGSGLYVSVTEYVNKQLAQWPPEGLAVYRRRYDDLARNAYERAAATGDASEMASVARQFWASSIGPRAADEAAELALEAGRFNTAIDLWSRVLADAPKSGVEKANLAPIMAKLAVALAWNGQPEQAEQMRQRLARGHPDWPNTFGGGGETLVKWAERHRESLLSAGTRRATPGDYPVLGGGADRNSIAPGGLNFGAELWHFAGHKTAGAQATRAVAGRSIRTRKVVLLLQPVIADRVIYLSSPAGVFAIGADNGSTPLWRNTSLATSRATAQVSGYAFAQLYSPTYADGRVYVDFGSPIIRSYWGKSGSGSPGSGIACLDANSGKMLWKLEIDTVPGLRGGMVDSSPLVFGGRVFVVVHVVRSVFDSCVLLAADAHTGNVLWHQQITESDTGGGYAFIRTQMVLPAAEGNTIYLSTNMGTVAAVAADSGLIRWLRPYERISRSRPGQPFFRPTPTARPTTEFSPTLVWNGRVVVAPPDCNDLLVLDAQNGKLLRKLNRKGKLYDAKEVFGIVDGKLYARGTEVVCWDLVANKRAWHSHPDDAPTYRGCLTRDFLYVPTKKYLLRFDLAKAGRQERFRWPRDDSHGTVLLTDQQIISINPTRIAGFCEWEEAQKRSLAMIAADPSNPRLRLIYAHHAYATSHLKLAQEQLAKAVEVVGGFAMLTDPKLKRLVFTDALAFARANWRPDPRAALELLKMASLCPPDVEGHVRYRMELARYCEDNPDLPRAVRYYQEIISDPTMRASTYRLGDEGKADAGRYAREQVDRLVFAHGAKVYQAVAAEADRDYARAADRQDWDEVRRLIHRFPNAERTRAEIFRLAEHFAAMKHYESAILWLRFFRREYPATLDRHPQEDVKVLTWLANYSLDLRGQWLARKNLDERTRTSQARRALRRAYGFLSKGRRHPRALVTVAGVRASFLEHRERMEARYGKLLQMVPHVMLPLKSAGTIALTTSARVLKPRLGGSMAVNDDIVLVNVLSGQNWDLQGFRPAKSRKPLWHRKYDLGRGAVISLITCHEDRAIIQQLHRVKGLDPESGEIVWTAEVNDPNKSGLRFFAKHENLLLATGRTNTACVVDMDDGKVQAELKLPDRIDRQPSLTDRVIAYVSRQHGIKLVVVDWRTGRRICRLDPVTPDILWTGIGADGRVLVAGGRTSLAAYDVDSGKLLWKILSPAQRIMPVASFEIHDRWIYAPEFRGGQWHVVKRDITNKGKPAWDFAIPQPVRTLANPAVRLTVQDDEVFALAYNMMVVVDADTGKLSYMTAMHPGDVVRDFIVTQDYLILLCVRNQGRPIVRAGRVPQMQLEVRLYDRTPDGGRLEQSLSISVQGWGQTHVVAASPGLVTQGNNKLYVYQPAPPRGR